MHMNHPHDRYSESEDATRMVRASLGGDSVTIPGALVLLLLFLSVVFLFFNPRVSLMLFPLILIGLVVCIARYNANCMRLKIRCPHCDSQLLREERMGNEFFVCHDCRIYGKGREAD